jgi:hypothetical protein
LTAIPENGVAKARLFGVNGRGAIDQANGDCGYVWKFIIRQEKAAGSEHRGDIAKS